jgi:ELWxxDGT repeat protein
MFRFWLRRLFQHSLQTAGPRRASRQRASRPRLEALEDRTLLSAGLVKDINPTGFSANPSGFATLNGSAYFFADDGVHGVELWKSNGSAGGTQLVKDLNPGSGSSSLSHSPPPLVFNNGLYFFANDGAHGTQLWKSDGTGANTVALTSGAPGTPTSLNQVAAANGLIFFADPATNELWKSDGTPGGTVAVTDSQMHTIGSASDLTTIGGTLYFSGEQADGQSGLWKSNGTPGGTQFLKPISGPISDLTDVGGTAYFLAPTIGIHGSQDVALWTSNGTGPGTTVLHDFGSVTAPAPLQVANLTAFNGQLYFAADDKTALPDAGVELWTSDGTSLGTTMVTDINLGSSSGLSLQSAFASVNGNLYFLADDSSGFTLWQTDGTALNTTQVLDGNSDPIASTGLLTVVNTDLYFAGANASGAGLWKTNGTNTDFVQSAFVDAAVPRSSIAVNGVLFFSARDGTHGNELWTSNGTAGGTGMVTDIGLSTASDPQAITDVNGVAYFVANDGNNGTGLFKSDGTPGGTQLLKGNLDFGGSPHLLNVNGTIYFFAFDGNLAKGTVQLWKSNTSTGVTERVTGFASAQSGPFGFLAGLPDTLTNVNGEVFFVADDGTHGLELWKSDGTEPGTMMVQDLNTGPSSSNPSELTPVGTNLFFTATDGTNSGLWKFDGSTATFLQAGASNLLNVGGTLAFTGPDSANPQNGPALWKWDGNSITLVKSLGAGNSPGLLTNVNGALAFVVDSSSNTETLWRSNGTDASTIPLHTFAGSRALSELTALGNTLYFINHAAANPELWKSNGTVAGTAVVTTLQSAFSPAFFDLTNINGALVFAASDGSHGQELWTSNGTTAGFAQDINVGVAGSFPHDLTSVGGRLFLAASDGTHGTELFADLGLVSRSPTSTVLNASPSVVQLGMSVTITAQVRPPHGNVDGGNVTFLLDGQTVLGTVPVNSSGIATSSPVLSAGPHSIVAVYGGDLNFSGSVSKPVGVLVVVVPGPTTTTITLSAPPSTVVQGQPITFSATVTPTPDGGNVIFFDGPIDLGMAPVINGGATLPPQSLDLGPHDIIAVYQGDGQFGGSVSSSAEVTVTISNPQDTTTTLTTPPGPVGEGQSITITASVTPTPDGGQVTFMDGPNDVLGVVPVDEDGFAGLDLVLPLGDHDIIAFYSGDADFNSSNSPVVRITVNATNGTDTTLSASPTTVVEGDFVTLSSSVTPKPGGPANVDGGQVTFFDGSTTLGTVDVDANGDAVLHQLFQGPLGLHNVTAVYSGDPHFAGSTSSTVGVTVEEPAATRTILTASATNVPLGQSVTFTATVEPLQGGGTVDDGEVDFKDGSIDLGMFPVDANGVARLDHAFGVGMHHVTAFYLGVVDFTASNSSTIDVTVTSPSQPISTSTILTASATHLNSGQFVTLTASVSAHNNGSPVPVDGSNILFMDNGALFASEPVNVSTGTAVLTTLLVPGTHNITAVYFGDANFSSSTSSPVPITVVPPPSGDITPVVEVTPLSITSSRAGPGRVFTETMSLENIGQVPLQGRLFVVVNGLHSDVKLRGADGFVGRKKHRRPFVVIDLGGATVQPNGSIQVKLRFNRRPGRFTLSIFANELA